MFSENIDDMINAVVRGHVHSANVVKVIVETDDGGTVVVNVIFEGKLDASETAQLSRHVWAKLTELGDTRFPLLSFIAKSEAARSARFAHVLNHYPAPSTMNETQGKAGTNSE